VPYRFFDHTGDVGIELEASEVSALFADAALALTATIADPAHLTPLPGPPISLAAADIDLLLVDWLSELLYRFETERWLPAAADVTLREGPDGWQLDATATGGVTTREVRVLVKAVTYHGLTVRQLEGRWRARVVLDI
jgi:SHS2 domain-containing protein